jgi:hypothetical protein
LKPNELDAADETPPTVVVAAMLALEVSEPLHPTANRQAVNVKTRNSSIQRVSQVHIQEWAVSSHRLEPPPRRGVGDARSPRCRYALANRQSERSLRETIGSRIE